MNCAFIDYFVRRLRQFSQRICKKITYIRISKFKIQRIKYLFISIKVQLQSVTSYFTSRKQTVQEVPSKKKKPQERERKRKKRWKREEEGKGKRGRETKKEGDEEGRGKERKRECERKGE